MMPVSSMATNISIISDSIVVSPSSFHSTSVWWLYLLLNVRERLLLFCITPSTVWQLIKWYQSQCFVMLYECMLGQNHSLRDTSESLFYCFFCRVEYEYGLFALKGMEFSFILF